MPLALPRDGAASSKLLLPRRACMRSVSPCSIEPRAAHMATQVQLSVSNNTAPPPPEPGRRLAATVVVAMRPRQWSKNLIVFVGAVFALRFTEPAVVVAALGAFLSFCLLSSAGYLLNDVFDA